jgi:hypothetical protein
MLNFAVLVFHEFDSTNMPCDIKIKPLNIISFIKANFVILRHHVNTGGYLIHNVFFFLLCGVSCVLRLNAVKVPTS